MNQEVLWQCKYEEMVAFIETHHRNPSKYNPEERGRYCTWLRHNRKLFNAGAMKPERREAFSELLALMEQNKHKNQYE